MLIGFTSVTEDEKNKLCRTLFYRIKDNDFLVDYVITIYLQKKEELKDSNCLWILLLDIKIQDLDLLKKLRHCKGIDESFDKQLEKKIREISSKNLVTQERKIIDIHNHIA